LFFFFFFFFLSFFPRLISAVGDCFVYYMYASDGRILAAKTAFIQTSYY